MTNKSMPDVGFSMGDRTLDAQHQKIMDIYAEVVELEPDNGDNGKRQFLNKVNDLIAMIADHFLTEEEALRRHGYPGLNTHIADHNKYLEQLRNIMLAEASGAVNKAALIKFASNLLQNHIFEHDRDYSRFMRNSGG